MTPFQALTLGVLQGLTEFLPISSSGHLILVPTLLGWPDQGLAFDAAVHLGTALALVCYFARELALGSPRAPVTERRAERSRLVAAVLLGSLPVGLAGVLLGSAVEATARSAPVVAASLIGWGLVLWWADRRAPGAVIRALGEIPLSRALLIGCAQAVALVPGTSRSGITISAGLLTGLDRPTAARFAFLLGLPVTGGAGFLKTAALLSTGLSGPDAAALAIGLGASFLAGLTAISWLIRYLQHGRLTAFVVYRIGLGVLVVWLLR